MRRRRSFGVKNTIVPTKPISAASVATRSGGRIHECPDAARQTTGRQGFTLNDSGIYGLKIGHFLPDRLNWLGFEIEGFNTSPNIKQSQRPGRYYCARRLASSDYCRVQRDYTW